MNARTNSGSNPKGRPRIVVVGSGFAGLTCPRELERRLGREGAELTLVSPIDYLLYSPLLPEVAAGAMGLRHIVVPLHGALKRTRVILGHVTGVDLEARTCTVSPPNAPERVLGWDRLVLAPGGVTRSFPIPLITRNEQERRFRSAPRSSSIGLDNADTGHDENSRPQSGGFLIPPGVVANAATVGHPHLKTGFAGRSVT